MRRPIDFLILGAQKCATTALYTWLQAHPEIYLPSVKENLYFVKDEFYLEGDRFLDPFYRGARTDQILGGAYVHLLYFTEAAARIRQHNPDMRLVAVLRNPIDRAYSAYWFARRNGWEATVTFEEAIEEEVRRRAGSFRERAELTYLDHGLYARQLEAYLRVFPRHQLRVLLTRDLEREPEATVNGLLEWLGVRPGGVSSKLMKTREHESGQPRFPGLHRMMLSGDNGLRVALRRVVSPRVRYRIRELVLLPLARLNIKPFKYPAMRTSTRARLKEYYREPNRRLEELIKRDLSVWNS